MMKFVLSISDSFTAQSIGAVERSNRSGSCAQPQVVRQRAGLLLKTNVGQVPPGTSGALSHPARCQTLPVVMEFVFSC